MNVLNKILYISAFIILVLWVYDSFDYGHTLMFSKDSKIKEIKEYDELFGTETIKTQIDKGFWLGLMPADDSFSIKAVIAVVPMIGIIIFIRILTFFIDKRFRRKNEEN